MKILLIEDNNTIAKQLVEFLALQHWVVDHAHKGKLGEKLALEDIYDVIILDLNLPDIDGLTLCERIKNQATITPPILMLTARDTFEDKSLGFHKGADDYLTKPVDLRELALRCQALSRRNMLHKPKQLQLGELFIDLTRQTATRNHQVLALTSTSFTILSVLAQQHPTPVSRSELMHKIWGDNPPNTDALKSHIYSLRSVLDKPFDKPLLKTILNIGFKLDIT
ncbi:response regulator transcription factor [Thalassotalea sp. SU-HH00458]|uniref:response regulator transcription factor n=1 Tax=Thalassotalea sp. SU-HH00458 TaxID=3127657 RepID=UPI00310C53B7